MPLFECIVINDGSEDDTGKTVANYIENTGDDRFRLITQERCGLGAARNTGIETASGKYIVFYNAYDSIPDYALKYMVNLADSNNAELVIGDMEFISLSEKLKDKATESLLSNKKIDPFDENIIMNGYLGNKLFRKEILLNNKIMCSSSDDEEDLLFCLKYIGVCNLISSCPSIVYCMEKRPFWLDNVQSLKIDTDCLEKNAELQQNCMSVLRTNYETRRSSIEQENKIALREIDNRYDKIVSKAYCRFARINYLDKIYRFLWTINPDVINKLNERIDFCRKHAFPYDWETEVTYPSRDLPQENDKAIVQEQASSHARITFAISGMRDSEEINKVICGLYSQDFPAFQVLVQSETYHFVDPYWKTMANLSAIDADESTFKREAFEQCSTKYIWFIDTPVYFSQSIVRRMFRFFNVYPKSLFLSVPVMTKHENNFGRNDANAVAFLPEYSMQKKRTAYNQLDYLWGNKVFRVSKLLEMSDPFGQGDRETLDRFYKYSRYTKSTEFSILTDLTEKDILKKVKSLKVKTRWRTILNAEDKLQERLGDRTVRQFTIKEQTRKWKSRSEKRLFRFLTRKLIYPIIYMLYSMRPVKKDKILFVEPTQLEPTNSLKLMIDAINKIGKYQVVHMSLGYNKVRKRQQMRREIKFLKEFAVSRYVFTTEALATVGGFAKRKETTLVQLWHGCGAFKKFGFSTAELLFGGNLQEKLRYPDYRNLDLITVSSPDVIWAYEEAMNYKGAGIVQATGISRTDIFYDDKYLEEARRRIFDTVPEARGKKIILYAPTFRGRVKRAKAPDQLEIEEMYKALGDEYFLLIKHHPHVKARPPVPAECTSFARDVTTEATIDDLLCCTDICISDYSSLIFEYSLFEKPMLFFAYDLEKYNDWRGFYYDYDELTPGPVVMSTDEIIKFIQNIDTEFDKEAVEEFRQKFMSSCDGHATERILKKIGILS